MPLGAWAEAVVRLHELFVLYHPQLQQHHYPVWVAQVWWGYGPKNLGLWAYTSMWIRNTDHRGDPFLAIGYGGDQNCRIYLFSVQINGIYSSRSQKIAVFFLCRCRVWTTAGNVCGSDVLYIPHGSHHLLPHNVVQCSATVDKVQPTLGQRVLCWCHFHQCHRKQ